MAISFGALGAVAHGTTSLSVPHPSGIAAGHLLALAIVNKYPTNAPSTPAGWTAGPRSTGGTTPNGSDQGQLYISWFYKVATGSEAGNLAVTITGGNTSSGRMYRFANATGTWDVAGCTMTNTVNYAAGSTAVNCLGDSDPGIAAGDMVLTNFGCNTDVHTISGQAVSSSSRRRPSSSRSTPPGASGCSPRKANSDD